MFSAYLGHLAVEVVGVLPLGVGAVEQEQPPRVQGVVGAVLVQNLGTENTKMGNKLIHAS